MLLDCLQQRMSANNNADKTNLQSSIPSMGRPSRMDMTASRYPSRGVMGEAISEPGMALPTRSRLPPAFPPSLNTTPEDYHSRDVTSRPRSQELIQLPPIRNLDLQLNVEPQECNLRPEKRNYYPPHRLMPNARYTPFEQALSPPPSNKRKRQSYDDDEGPEARNHVVLRSYRNSPRMPPPPSLGPISHPSSTRRGNVILQSTWASPQMGARGLPAPQQSFESGVPRSDFRPELPSLASLSTTYPRPQLSEYSLESSLPSPSRPSAQTYSQLVPSPILEPPTYPQYPQPSPSPPNFSYVYQQPRGQSYPGSSGYSPAQDRSPFSSNSHYSMHQSAGSPTYRGMNGNDGHSDGKPRKRRGNLPKETTDKLRAWFIGNLGHPYPTEDQKQELMRQTGLQMNQISNWFINARRRQLPAMINNARAESRRTSATHRDSSSDIGGEGMSRESSGNGFGDGYGTNKRLKRESV